MPPSASSPTPNEPLTGCSTTANSEVTGLEAASEDAASRPVTSLFAVVEQPVKGSFGVGEDAEGGMPRQGFLVRPDHSTVPISLVEPAITHGDEPAGRVMIIHDMTAE